MHGGDSATGPHLSDQPAQVGGGDLGPASSLSHAGQDTNEIVQPQQIAVLTVALLPGSPMIQDLAIGEGRGLAKIDEPYTSTMTVVMHEEE